MEMPAYKIFFTACYSNFDLSTLLDFSFSETYGDKY